MTPSAPPPTPRRCRPLVGLVALVLALSLATVSGTTTATAVTASSNHPTAARAATRTQARQVARSALRTARRSMSGRATRTDASMALLRLRLTLDALPPAGRRAAAAVLARPTDNPDFYGLAYTTSAKRACSRHICIHWVPTGRDAPPDRAWVDRQLRMLEHVWKYEVDELGYHRPRSDGARGGGGSGKFDVYLAELYRRGLYGLTVAERPVPHHRHLYSSYLVIDNDFLRSQFHGPPMQVARVTAAHEFFHAIQYGYDADEDPWLMETSSTWMEEQFDDSSDDNRQYLAWSQLHEPGIPLDTYSSTGFEQYGNWVFLEYLSERFGRRVVRRIWKQAAALGGHRYSAAAIRAVLRRYGGMSSVFGSYANGNTAPGSTYAEGVAYPVAGITLTAASPRKPWTSYDVRHLSSVNLRASPGGGLTGSGWRLWLTVDGPRRATAPAVAVRVARTGGPATQTLVPLSRGGHGLISVPFGSADVRRVTITLANASTRFTCHTGGSFSCRGTSKDPLTRFRVRLVARHH
jgi:hypothetical protein